MVERRLIDQRSAPNSPLAKQVEEGGSKPCKVVEVLVIVVTQAKELLYILDAHWNRPFFDGHKLGWIHISRASTNNIPKILNGLP